MPPPVPPRFSGTGTGQSYKIGSRSLTRADLAQLKAIRDDLEAQIDSGTDNCLLDRTFVAFFDGR